MVREQTEVSKIETIQTAELVNIKKKFFFENRENDGKMEGGNSNLHPFSRQFCSMIQ